MNRSRLSNLAWHFAWPLLLLAVDLIIRARVIRVFTPWEWFYYLASVVLSFVFFGCFLWCARLLREKCRRWIYLGALGLVASSYLFIVFTAYHLYFANGDLPDLFLLSFIRCETENVVVMIRDSFRWYEVILGPAGAILLGLWFHHASLRHAFGRPLAAKGKLAVGALGYAAMWCCWHGTATHGQCFVPVVRTPAICALYAYNECKGINPQPIELRARTPLPVDIKIARPPVNVLLILNESLRRQDLQLFGYTRDTTPKMSQFAREHPDNFFAFPHAYTNSTSTLLSVPSILTGISPLQPVESRCTAPLLWQWARAADMRSFYISSHDLSWCRMRRFLTNPSPDVFWDKESSGQPKYRDMGIDDHITVDRAVTHLRELAAAGQPFCGVVHINTNHYPYNSRAEYLHWSGTPRDLYDNTITETDTHAGKLLDTLRDTGLLDHTVVVFASDHGEAFNEHGYIAHFYCHYVETISVPLWIYLPPEFARSRDLTALRENRQLPVQNLDILPTLLDCIGAWENPATASLREPMLGNSLLRPIDMCRKLWITNTDEIMPSTIGLSSVEGTRHYMLRVATKPARESLFDLATDPTEQHDLWPDCPPEERNIYRNGFQQFPVADKMMRTAVP